MQHKVILAGDVVLFICCCCCCCCCFYFCFLFLLFQASFFFHRNKNYFDFRLELNHESCHFLCVFSHMNRKLNFAQNVSYDLVAFKWRYRVSLYTVGPIYVIYIHIPYLHEMTFSILPCFLFVCLFLFLYFFYFIFLFFVCLFVWFFCFCFVSFFVLFCFCFCFCFVFVLICFLFGMNSFVVKKLFHCDILHFVALTYKRWEYWFTKWFLWD